MASAPALGAVRTKRRALEAGIVALVVLAVAGRPLTNTEKGLGPVPREKTRRALQSVEEWRLVTTISVCASVRPNGPAKAWGKTIERGGRRCLLDGFHDPAMDGFNPGEGGDRTEHPDRAARPEASADDPDLAPSAAGPGQGQNAAAVSRSGADASPAGARHVEAEVRGLRQAQELLEDSIGPRCGDQGRAVAFHGSAADGRDVGALRRHCRQQLDGLLAVGEGEFYQGRVYRAGGLVVRMKHDPGDVAGLPAFSKNVRTE